MEPPSPLPGVGARTEPFEELDAYLDRFTETVDTRAITALIVGKFPFGSPFESTESDGLRDRLIALAPRLTGLRALFFGEILREECEASWIRHGDLGPLLAAYPRLTEFTVRGSGGLRFGVGQHRSLRRLTVQSSGIDPEVVESIVGVSLPGLQHLELWLGVAEDGAATPEDCGSLLSGEAFPGLPHLGLRNAEFTDDWVRALAEAPVTPTLRTLDLSLGALTDEGARVLLDAPAFRSLDRLDLHHHYMSEDMTERVREAFTAAGVRVDVSDRWEPDREGCADDEDPWLYPAVAE
ncbi:STM4015 family protein [Nocardiopsis sp. EMB25]|uniref:STM4015 family protein n=1 Tax=Nocardiopsis sp. EMB25 TaxID=2835867 RepID=UPI00228530BE|nr:STM4015 family protein [Nocardiopsis sp. EMB25]MCY9783125.1 STM4015 family protein [Nocardiopsis sp. EMB25]